MKEKKRNKILTTSLIILAAILLLFIFWQNYKNILNAPDSLPTLTFTWNGKKALEMQPSLDVPSATFDLAVEQYNGFATIKEYLKNYPKFRDDTIKELIRQIESRTGTKVSLDSQSTAYTGPRCETILMCSQGACPPRQYCVETGRTAEDCKCLKPSNIISVAYTKECTKQDCIDESICWKGTILNGGIKTTYTGNCCRTGGQVIGCKCVPRPET